MNSLLIISNRSVTDLLTDESLETLPTPRILTVDELPETVESLSDRDNILLVDVGSSDDLTGPVNTVRQASGDFSLIALINPNSLRQMYKLKEMKIKVYLRCPVKISVLRQAMDAIEKNRKFVDPSLSDSIVELFLK